MRFFFKKEYFILPVVFSLLVGLVLGMYLIQKPKTDEDSLSKPLAQTSSDRALIYMNPHGGDWAGIRAYMGGVGSSNFPKLNSSALRLPQSICHHPRRASENSAYGGFFPYSKLKQLEAEGLAQGKPPLFVTATYGGKTRQVVFYYTAESDPFDAVNIADDRFIKFFAEEYVKKIVWPGGGTLDATQWLGCDTGIFGQQFYGIIDDNGKYISGVKWDNPFAQNNSEFYDSLVYFFSKLRQDYPDIKLFVNMGSMDWSRFEDVWGLIPGVLHERTLDFEQTIAYHRDSLYRKYNTIWPFMRARGKTVIMYYRNIPSSDAAKVRTVYISYLLAKGDNFFHAIKSTGEGYKEIPPSTYEPIKSALGEPVGSLESSHESGKREGYRLYSRRMQKGIVYLNLTGVTKTITLPTDRNYYDRSGNLVTKITIPDFRGDYVVSNQQSTPAPTPKSLIGDFDNDNDLDINDIALMLAVYTQLSVSVNSNNSKFDVDNNNKIDIADIALVLANYTSLVVYGN